MIFPCSQSPYYIILYIYTKNLSHTIYIYIYYISTCNKSFIFTLLYFRFRFACDDPTINVRIGDTINFLCPTDEYKFYIPPSTDANNMYENLWFLDNPQQFKSCNATGKTFLLTGLSICCYRKERHRHKTGRVKVLSVCDSTFENWLFLGCSCGICQHNLLILL